MRTKARKCCTNLTLTALPADVILYAIIPLLSPKDIVYLSFTGKYFNTLLCTTNNKKIWSSHIVTYFGPHLLVLFKLSSFYGQIMQQINTPHVFNSQNTISAGKFLKTNDDLFQAVLMIDKISKKLTNKDFPNENTTLAEINTFIEKHQLNEPKSLQQFLEEFELPELTKFAHHLYEFIKTISNIHLTIYRFDDSLKLPVFRKLNKLFFHVSNTQATTTMNPKAVATFLQKTRPCRIKVKVDNYTGLHKTITDFLLMTIAKNCHFLTAFSFLMIEYGKGYGDKDTIFSSLPPIMQTLCENNKETLSIFHFRFSILNFNHRNKNTTSYVTDCAELTIQQQRSMIQLLSALNIVTRLEDVLLNFTCENHDSGCTNPLPIFPQLLPPIENLNTDFELSLKELQTLFNNIQHTKLQTFVCDSVTLESIDDCNTLFKMIEEFWPSIKKFKIISLGPDDLIKAYFIYLQKNYNGSIKIRMSEFGIVISKENYGFASSFPEKTFPITKNTDYDLSIKFIPKFFCEKISEEEKLRELFKNVTDTSFKQNCIRLWDTLMEIKTLGVENCASQPEFEKSYKLFLSALIDVCELQKSAFFELDSLKDNQCFPKAYSIISLTQCKYLLPVLHDFLENKYTVMQQECFGSSTGMQFMTNT